MPVASRVGREILKIPAVQEASDPTHITSRRETVRVSRNSAAGHTDSVDPSAVVNGHMGDAQHER